jgi:O-antigen ligase
MPLWLASGALAVLLLERYAAVRALRRHIGRRRFAFHPSGLWVVLDEESPYGAPAWSFDLSRPAIPFGPLVVVGGAFLAWVALQLVPMPLPVVQWLNPRRAELVHAPAAGFAPLTVSTRDTSRGLAFVVSAWLLHLVAGAVFSTRAARRFRAFLLGLGAVLGVVALVQQASGSHRIYGLVDPIEYDGNVTAMGPFANRNHFAGYISMVACVALGMLVRNAGAYARRVGNRTNLRRWLVGMQSRTGIQMLYSFGATLVVMAAVLASNSRGALLAFAVALLATIVWRRPVGRASWVVLGLVLVLAFGFVGPRRLGERWRNLREEAPGRLIVWRTALEGAREQWLTGSGLNTFAAAISRTTAWALPKGATPWRAPDETSVTENPRMGYYSLLEAPRLGWYREAHNDYLQLLVETGLPGVLLAFIAVGRLLWAVRRDAFLTAALFGLLLHEVVDFDLQAPAVAVLFTVLAAVPPEAIAVRSDAQDPPGTDDGRRN